MAAISITAASVLASANAQVETRYLSGATITAGQFLYLDDNQAWQLYDMNSGVGYEKSRVRGISLNGASSGQPLRVCTKDPALVFGGTSTNGSTVYSFNTAGGISIADLPTTGDYPVVVGVLCSTTVLNLNPIASGAII